MRRGSNKGRICTECEYYGSFTGIDKKGEKEIYPYCKITNRYAWVACDLFRRRFRVSPAG